MWKCMEANFGVHATALLELLSMVSRSDKGSGSRGAQRPRFNELLFSVSSGYTIFRTTKWHICSLDSGNKALSWAPVCHTGLQGLLLDVVSLYLLETPWRFVELELERFWSGTEKRITKRSTSRSTLPHAHFPTGIDTTSSSSPWRPVWHTGAQKRALLPESINVGLLLACHCHSV